MRRKTPGQAYKQRDQQKGSSSRSSSSSIISLLILHSSKKWANKKPSILSQQEDEGDYFAAIVVPPPIHPCYHQTDTSRDLSRCNSPYTKHGAHRSTLTGANRRPATTARTPVHCLAHGCHREGSAAMLPATTSLSESQINHLNPSHS